MSSTPAEPGPGCSNCAITSVGVTSATTAPCVAPDASRYCPAVPGAGSAPPELTAVTDVPCTTAGNAAVRATVIVAPATAPVANSTASTTSPASIHAGCAISSPGRAPADWRAPQRPRNTHPQQT